MFPEFIGGILKGVYNPTIMRALIYVIPISIAVVLGAGGALVIQAVVNPSHDSGLMQNVANILGWGFWGLLIVGAVFMARAMADPEPAKTWNCSECETENNGLAKFCNDCGAKK